MIVYNQIMCYTTIKLKTMNTNGGDNQQRRNEECQKDY